MRRPTEASAGAGFPATSISASPDARRAGPDDAADMRPTYAVSWSTSSGRVHAGQLELGAEALTLRGGSRPDPVVERLAYEDLRSVRRARAAGDRVRGRASLVLELLTLAEVFGDLVDDPLPVHRA